jgi:pimeloyl-ACP methyl ester carboxylesterase
MPERSEVPTVLSSFAHDLVPAPRSYVEQFLRIERFVEHEAAGHFAAWEAPELYEADLRSAVTLSGHTE